MVFDAAKIFERMFDPDWIVAHDTLWINDKCFTLRGVRVKNLMRLKGVYLKSPRARTRARNRHQRV